MADATATPSTIETVYFREKVRLDTLLTALRGVTPTREVAVAITQLEIGSHCLRHAWEVATKNNLT